MNALAPAIQRGSLVSPTFPLFLEVVGSVVEEEKVMPSAELTIEITAEILDTAQVVESYGKDPKGFIMYGREVAF